jgi:hypothetical protein
MADYILSLKADVSQVKKGVESVGDSLKGLQKSASNFGKLIGVGLAIKGFDLLASAMAAPVKEAQDAAREIEGLNLALSLSGQLSKENTKAFEDLAESLETTSIFSGGAVLGAAQLALNLGATADQAKGLVKAAADLSAATGVDLDTATQALTKSLQGQGAQLGKLVPQLKGMKEEALRAGDGLAFVSSRFQGAATAAGNTFSGSILQSREAFNKLLETIGNFLVQNPVVIFLIKQATALFGEFTAYINENKDSIMALVQNGIIFLADSLAFVAGLIGNWVIPIIQTMQSIVLRTFNAILDLADVIGIALDPVLNAIGRSLTFATAAFVDLLKLLLKIPGASKALGAMGVDAESLEKSMTGASKALVGVAQNVDFKKARDGFRQLGNDAGNSIIGIQGKFGEAALGIENRLKTFSSKAGSLVGTSIQTAVKNIPPVKAPVEVDQEKLKKSIKEAFDNASKDPIGGVFELAGVTLSKDFASKSEAQFAGIFQGLTAAVGKGAEGARGLVVQTLTAGATALLGPFGQALGPIFDLLSQGPEKVKQTIDAFTSALPSIISNIVLAIPVLIQSITESIPLIIDNLIANLPMMIDALIESLPSIILAAVTLMPRITTAFTFGLIKAIPKIIEAFIIEIPTMIYEFTAALVNSAWDFVMSIYDAVKEIFPGLGGVQKAASGDFGGAISDTLGGIGDFFGFAEGGMVPAGYPNDSFPAKLTSGEAILPTDTVAKLESFLANGGGAGQNVTVNLVVGEEQLAKVMLNLNRQGFRVN